MMERKGQELPFSIPEILFAVDPLLAALSFTHQYTIRRNIIPEDTMVIGGVPNVETKVLDFGGAETLGPSNFTQTAQSLGTSYYMPSDRRGRRDRLPCGPFFQREWAYMKCSPGGCPWGNSLCCRR